jgi:hypothetical protein
MVFLYGALGKPDDSQVVSLVKVAAASVKG